MRIGNLFHLSYWLDPSVIAQHAGTTMWLVVALGALWCGVGLVTAFGRRSSRDVSLAQVLAGALVSAVALGRLYTIPVLGLRAGWLVAAAIAVFPIAVYALREAYRDGLAGDCLRAFAFSSTQENHWSAVTSLTWLGLHLLSMLVVLSIMRLPEWLALIMFALLIVPQLIAAAWHNAPIRRALANSNTSMQSAHRHFSIPVPNLSVLTPLLVIYLVVVLRLLVSLAARLSIGQFRVISPFDQLLDLPSSLMVMGVYAFAVSCYQAVKTCTAVSVGQHAPTPGILSQVTYLRAASIVWVLATLVWAVWNALTLHTQGVTGSDPYAYTQMGIDLVRTGTVFHSFPLVQLTYNLGIPSEPIVHVGYRLPQDITRTAPTVWPPGYAVFTALGYLVGGELGIYLITPLISLLSLGAVWALSYWLSRDISIGDGAYAAAALAVFFTATSYQQVQWQLVPMADIAAQLFSLLALYAALRARAGPGIWIGAILSGLALGVAFDIRYTQVLLAPTLVYALVTAYQYSPSPTRPRHRWAWLGPVCACAGAALIAAAPVLAYHVAAFGSPFLTGSEELANFSFTLIPQTLASITGELLSVREFGLLWPLIAAGGIVLWRYARRACIALGIYFIPLFAFHIAYSYLRPRDILFLFPVLAITAAVGTVWLVSWLMHHGQKVQFMAARAVLLIVLAFTFFARSSTVLALPITHGFDVFGYLVREQRESFTQLAQLTPSNAVIGCTLNSGAVDLYANRRTFRPANWSSAQVIVFIRAIQAEGAPVYVLDDGTEIRPTLTTLRTAYRLTSIARLDMPYFYPGGGSENRKVSVYRLDSLR